MVKQLLIITLLFGIGLANSFAQSVGLVLSGGGAKGLAHIGVIKALEENNIPIDYIAGTSMGAIVGGLYAIGYSPDEMELLLTSEEFIKWSYGYIDIDEEYYYKLKKQSADWIEFPIVKKDGDIIPKLPTNVISPEQMDLRFIEFFEPACAGANYDFNNLMVPFFCIATDVYNNKPVILNSGNLSAAIRASMTFPGYFKPIEIDSVLLFDGGMENNFPTDIMVDKFNPDIIIGSKVAWNPKKPDADDLYEQLENVFMKSTNYAMPKNGILIEPDVKEFSLMDFTKFDTLYARGYEAAIKKIDSVKLLISRREGTNELGDKRSNIKSRYKELVFKNIYITGVDHQTVSYIIKNIRRNRSIITFAEFETEYFKLLSDKLIRSIFPKVVYNEASGYFDLYLDIKVKNEFAVSLGGNISSNLRNMGFVGIDYIFQKKNIYNLSANLMIGKFYNSLTGKFQMDFPPRNINKDKILTPFYVDFSATINNWDYFQITSNWFVDSKTPTKLMQSEVHFQTNLGRPIKNRGLLYAGFSYGKTHDNYFHTNLIESNDISDETIFDYSSVHTTYEYSTLNYKEYANKGSFMQVQGRYITGLERYTPGTTTGITNPQPSNTGHSWYNVRFNYIHYFEPSKLFSLGINSYLNITNKSQFNNSVSTLLSAYAFQPFPQSKLVFLKNFRANMFAAIGFIPVVNITESISIRAESYIFQPYQYIEIDDYNPSFSKTFPTPSLAASLATVYQSPLGPFALTASYFSNEPDPFYFQINFGYILFNKRGLD